MRSGIFYWETDLKIITHLYNLIVKSPIRSIIFYLCTFDLIDQ